MQSSLTADWDKNELTPDTLNSSAQPLTDTETKQAVKELCVKYNFPQLERRFIDPPIPTQKIALVSFVPARGATPDEKGIYGMAKVRYVAASVKEADEEAEKLIKTVDSFHKIHYALVGHPFPMTTSSDFSASINEVDIKQAITNAYKDEVKRKREEDAKQIEEIQAREKELLKDVSTTESSEDTYTTLKVKKAQLSWTYLETVKKVEQMRILIAKCRRELYEMEQKDENLAKVYFDKYVEARQKAGLRSDKQEIDNSFMRYLVEDVTIPEIDQLYKEMYETPESLE